MKEFMEINANSAANLQLAVDLDFAAISNFKPLIYTGTLDGRGHSIKNLVISNGDIICKKFNAVDTCELNLGIFGKSDFL